MQLERIRTRVRDSYRATFDWTPELVEMIAARCTESSSGARNVENILTRTLLPELSAEVLARLADGETIQSVKPASTRMGCFSLPSTNRKALLFPLALSRRSTVAIYMKFGSINGDVTTDGYKDWIELNSFQFGVSRAVSSGAGGNTRESSAPNISEIVVTKYFDKASAKLYQDSLAGSLRYQGRDQDDHDDQEQDRNVPHL